MNRDSLLSILYPDMKIPIPDIPNWPTISQAVDNLVLAMSGEHPPKLILEHRTLSQFNPVSKKINQRIVEIREAQDLVDWPAVAGQINREFDLNPPMSHHAAKKRYYVHLNKAATIRKDLIVEEISNEPCEPTEAPTTSPVAPCPVTPEKAQKPVDKNPAKPLPEEEIIAEIMRLAPIRTNAKGVPNMKWIAQQLGYKGISLTWQQVRTKYAAESHRRKAAARRAERARPIEEAAKSPADGFDPKAIAEKVRTGQRLTAKEHGQYIAYCRGGCLDTERDEEPEPIEEEA